VELKDRVQVLHTQVEQLSALLSDVFNTDASTGPWKVIIESCSTKIVLKQD
jgi:hypothetical protein